MSGQFFFSFFHLFFCSFSMDYYAFLETIVIVEKVIVDSVNLAIAVCVS